jgi:hypothetical protein
MWLIGCVPRWWDKRVINGAIYTVDGYRRDLLRAARASSLIWTVVVMRQGGGSRDVIRSGWRGLPLADRIVRLRRHAEPPRAGVDDVRGGVPGERLSPPARIKDGDKHSHI